MLARQNFLIGRWAHSATLDAHHEVVTRYQTNFHVYDFLDHRMVEITTECGDCQQIRYCYFDHNKQLTLIFILINSKLRIARRFMRSHTLSKWSIDQEFCSSTPI